VIGKGGMGEVWSAYDRKLGRRVALKLVDFGSGELDDGRARFAREVSVSQQLRGPAFAEVYAHGTHGDRAYLVMELLEGETLQARLARAGTLTIAEATDLLKGIVIGLRLAHALRIVHRDLKPSNIFLAKVKPSSSGARPLDGRKEIVKLLDFGIAKETWDDGRITNPGVMMGSAHYMSPEQISSGRDVDPRADLWGVAALLYRALTGVKPFDGTPSEALGKILSEKAPPLSRNKPGLPPGLEWFFDTAFKKDPAKRFQTIDDLCDGFSQAVTAIAAERVSDPLHVDIVWEGRSPEDSKPTVLEARPLPRLPVLPPAAPAPVRISQRFPRWLAPVVITIATLSTLFVAWMLRLFGAR